MIDSQQISSLFERQQGRALMLREETVSDRKRLLKRFEAFLLLNRERINTAIQKDFNKPFAEVELSELYPVITEIRHAVANLGAWAAPKKIDAPITFVGTRSEVRFEPRGVCLIISPWNFPFNLCFGPLISCLAAGNTAILKPSELTPSASSLIAELVKEFFEEDRVAVIEGDADVSTALLKLPFDHIFFTGSPAIGKIVMKAAAENLTSVTLELGGKSPAIIDKSANIDDAARRIAFGKFLNNGQTCVAPDYVLIDDSIRNEFISALKLKTTELFGTDGKVTESSSSYARIVNERNFNRLTLLKEDAIRLGATEELGGPSNPATRFMPPSILTNVNDTMKIMQEEIFGPLLPVISYSSAADVPRIVNGRAKPLALYIFSKEKKFRDEILSHTSAGAACINDCVIHFSHPGLPFGGIGNSGIGKSHGEYGFRAFSNEKPIVRQKSGFAALYVIHPPYTSRVKKLLDLMIRWI